MNHDEMDSMSLIEYRARVQRAAALQNKERIYNGTTAHAQIVVESLFDTAREDVCVLNESMNNRVMGHDDTLDRVEVFLTRPNARLRVLVEREPDCGWGHSGFLRRFGERENVQVRLVPDAVRQRYNFHFTVVDRKSYRFEPDRRKHAAIAAFGDEPVGQNLASIFEQIWVSGTNLEIQRALA